MPRKMGPEERRRFEAQKAEWARTTRDFEVMYERLKARWHAEDERRARRRRFLRLPLRLVGRS
ncbi:MAG TPA: hypothetical protein VF877_06340 [Gaiellaceae bacterium]|jgi:hypothetical protein